MILSCSAAIRHVPPLVHRGGLPGSAQLRYVSVVSSFPELARPRLPLSCTRCVPKKTLRMVLQRKKNNAFHGRIRRDTGGEVGSFDVRSGEGLTRQKGGDFLVWFVASRRLCSVVVVPNVVRVTINRAGDYTQYAHARAILAAAYAASWSVFMIVLL